MFFLQAIQCSLSFFLFLSLSHSLSLSLSRPCLALPKGVSWPHAQILGHPLETGTTGSQIATMDQDTQRSETNVWAQ